MSLSLYYRVERDRPLDLAERTQVDEVLAGWGASGLGLVTDDPPDEGAVLSGSAQAPRDEDEFMTALNGWLGGLGALVPILGGSWRVAIDDAEIPWDPASGRFDLDAGGP